MVNSSKRSIPETKLRASAGSSTRWPFRLPATRFEAWIHAVPSGAKRIIGRCSSLGDAKNAISSDQPPAVMVRTNTS